MKSLTPCYSLLVVSWALAAPLMAADEKTELEITFGQSYWLVSDAQVDQCDVKGTAVAPPVTVVAPAKAIFRLVDTTAAGAAIIRFWRWGTDPGKAGRFNDVGVAPNNTPRFFLLSKEDLHKKGRAQTDKSSTNEQDDYDPLKEKPTGTLAGAKFLPLGRDRSFVYSLGTNFDFIENVQVSKTYHDLKIWVPRLSRAETGFRSRLGFEFMFNRFRTFSTPDSTDTQFRDVDGDPNDSTAVLHYITNNVKERSTSRFDNLGLTLNPMVRLTGKDREDVMIALIGNLEWQRSALSKTIERTFDMRDDTIPPEDWPTPYNTTDLLPENKEVIRTTTDNFYGGGGFRLMYRDDFGTLNLRACAGYAYFMVVGGGQELVSNEAAYYALQAEIIEHRISGVKLGAEIRGFFKRPDADPILSQPRFGLYIAKEFRLEKIGELFTP